MLRQRIFNLGVCIIDIEERYLLFIYLFCPVLRLLLHLHVISCLCFVNCVMCSFSSDMHDHTPNLDDLMNDVAIISAKWRLVGVQLKLPNGTLDEIQDQNAGRPDQCILSFFEQVCARWRSLGTSPYTWKTLINALRSPAVGEVTLANELNVKYCSLQNMDL